LSATAASSHYVHQPVPAVYGGLNAGVPALPLTRLRANNTAPLKGATLSISVDGKIVDLLGEFYSLPGAVPASGAVVNALDFIREKLSLSMTQLADLFGVTRKSVYDWYEGAEPRSNSAKRINILQNVLNAMPEGDYDLRQLKSVWNIEVNGASFRSLFEDDRLDESHLEAALKEKLNELSLRLVPARASTHKASQQLGGAWLADIERSADG
jgi:transcriptional regulator with XRE-family HTH domain